jgi:hypothetical protein
VPDVQDRHSGAEFEIAPLVRLGHPCPYLLMEPGHGVALVFEHAVNAIRVRNLFLEQAGSFRDRPRDVGGHPVYRVGVGVEDVLPP